MSGSPALPGPSTSFLVFDGDCAFCERCVTLGERILGRPFARVPFQFLDLTLLGLTAEQVSASIWWISDDLAARADGRHPAGHQAVAALLSAQPSRLWRLAGWMLDHPPASWAAAPLYSLIARNRYRLPGGTAACQVSSSTSDPPLKA